MGKYLKTSTIDLELVSSRIETVFMNQGCMDGGHVGRHAHQYFQICKKVSHKLAMLQES